MFENLDRVQIKNLLQEIAGSFNQLAMITGGLVEFEYSGGHRTYDFWPNAVEIPHTNTGYGHSVIELSNSRRLIEDFPYLVERNNSLWFVLDDQVTTFDYSDDTLETVTKEITDLIGALQEYPIYDDADYSLLESQRIIEEWEDLDWTGPTPEIPWDEQGSSFYLEEMGLYVDPELFNRLDGASDDDDDES